MNTTILHLVAIYNIYIYNMVAFMTVCICRYIHATALYY